MKAFIFDLDGTLIDSVYAHAPAWQRVLSDFGLTSPTWEIHRRIGMSGALLVKSLARACGRAVTDQEIKRLDGRHAVLFHRLAPVSKRLPGARQLLAFLRKTKVGCGCVCSGEIPLAAP